ncbi:hypothetical protein M5689_022520 [Euphorbia peplus]|nr:hypothetical protein M5689_022520 [Euphorbia peplus]
MERRGVGSALTPSMEKRKNKMMKLRAEMLAGNDSSGDETFTPDMLSILLCKEAEYDCFCELAQQALQLYKEREGVEFEVIEPLFLKSAWVRDSCLMAKMENKKKNKKNKNKKKRSRYGALLAQPGEIGGGVGGGSESQRLDKNKKKITGLEEVEKLQDDDRGLAHSGEIGGSSKRYQHKRKRHCGQDFTDEEESPEERFLGGNDSFQDMMIKPWPKLFEEAQFIFQCELAEKALQLYKEREGVEFEVVKPQCLESAYLRICGADLSTTHAWCHMSLTAKPKNNADCPWTLWRSNS